MTKLAVISSHPIQYYAPWFRYISTATNLKIKVFYLWDFGVKERVDVGFKKSIQWDIPLLDGYEYEFVPNISSSPGTHHFWGLQNPTLISQVNHYQPDAALLLNYNYVSIYRFLWQWNRRQVPLLFRGDSHRLVPDSGLKTWAKQQLISQIYQHFSACLYVGKANYEYFRYHGVPEQKLFFSPHAVDNERFLRSSEAATQQAKQWRKELNIPDDHAVILFVGKFEKKKRPLDLLQAFIEARLNHVSLLFVGSGSLEQDLKAQADEQPNVYFAPFQNQSLMPRTYAVADLVVLPSHGSSETWGLVINEAMCLARPVMTSTHVGCAQDLVSSGENGLVFPAGNVQALAKALQDAFADRQRLHHWGVTSHRMITQYSYAQATKGLEQALEYVLI